MKEINLAQVLSRLRREKGVTQEELAAYIGVSKASVSKWETGQSYPDIVFLPQLAAYFNTSVDELLGYEPQMTKEDIRRLYHELSRDFGEKPFEEVFGRCREIVKKYYSCFPLLLLMGGLLLNHVTLAGSEERMMEVLRYALELFTRVKSESGDVYHISSANSSEAACRLALKEPEAVLELLKDANAPLSGDEILYATAWQQLGNLPKAKESLQIGLYQHLVLLAGMMPTYLMMCADNREQFDETRRRAQALCDIFRLEDLHPNMVFQIDFVVAQTAMQWGDMELAREYLRDYGRICMKAHQNMELLSSHLSTAAFTLHGDSFFDQIEPWIAEFDLGADAPMNEKTIRESLVSAVSENPVFAPLHGEPWFRSLVEQMKASLM